jgi:hypothetical protein
MSETLKISDAVRKLRSITGSKVGYQTVWRRVQDGILAGEQIEGRRWAIKQTDIDAYAATLKERT